MSHLITLLALLLVLSSSSMMSQGQLGQPGGPGIPCSQVANELLPCLSYLDEQTTSPSSSCCQGTKYVWKHYGRGKSERQEVCECLESLLPLIGAVDGSLVSALPQRCGLNIELPPISAYFNCSQIH
ncbi:probable non-specific lipid-transfer protein 2 [Beta vulgaris subsp. vulgaris]|uniref:probable non-specific lipid-transfer protein 2 n=1 Tax=Beta vulgaris subsp. vulgaris TaxID=3555 RepID=UPI0020372297|nr:probable non-specific lipid-transfer protein 2 [Beta vulgaris subsp. vulgaris]